MSAHGTSIRGFAARASSTTRRAFQARGRVTISSPAWAMRAASPENGPHSSSARVVTAVEAMASARPKTRAEPKKAGQRHAERCAEQSIDGHCAVAPCNATRKTASRFSGRKWRPTPTSAMVRVKALSMMTPGVFGPMAMPATTYPISGGIRSIRATNQREREGEAEAGEEGRRMIHRRTFVAAAALRDQGGTVRMPW
jgi:hypothetical protein